MSAHHTPGPRIAIDCHNCGGSGCHECQQIGVEFVHATRPAGLVMPAGEEEFERARHGCPCYEGISVNVGVRQCTHADHCDHGECCLLQHCPVVDRAAIAKATGSASP